jgi:hypothetical protein
MLKCTKILGTASVLAMAALLASPAAAGPLTDFAGTLQTEYSNFNADNTGQDSNNWLLGGSAAAPLSDIANLNIQGDVSYNHSWESHFSQETWNFGGSAFWAGMDGRIGLNVNYLTATHSGHITTGGVLGEWYFGNITAMAKGGWVNGGGTATGGNGNYAGGAVEFYVMPDLGITGGVEWSQVIEGSAQQLAGRTGLNNTVWEITAEWLVAEEYGVSVYGGYAHDNVKFKSLLSNLRVDDEDNIFRIGLRWYLGGGSLVDHHRNGTLNPWLPAVNTGS